LLTSVRSSGEKRLRRGEACPRVSEKHPGSNPGNSAAFIAFTVPVHVLGRVRLNTASDRPIYRLIRDGEGLPTVRLEADEMPSALRRSTRMDALVDGPTMRKISDPTAPVARPRLAPDERHRIAMLLADLVIADLAAHPPEE
ncbi:MAG: hypothetical protein ABI551_06795, partial [Polyangiaceae bacterium]